MCHHKHEQHMGAAFGNNNEVLSAAQRSLSFDPIDVEQLFHLRLFETNQVRFFFYCFNYM